MDIEGILNESVDDVFGEVNNNDDKGKDDVGAILGDASDAVFTNEKPAVDAKKPKTNPRSTRSILRAASSQISQESQEMSKHVIGAAATSIEHDLNAAVVEAETDPGLVAQILEEAVREHDDDVARILESEEPEMSPAAIDKILEEADEDEYDNEYFNETKQSESQSESEEDDDDGEEEDGANDPALEMELRHCCYSGRVSAVEKIVKKGVNLLSTDSHGWTALHWAVSKNNDEIADILLSNCRRFKKLVNAGDKLCGFTPLHVMKPFPSVAVILHHSLSQST